MTIFPCLADQELQVTQVIVADEVILMLQARSPTASCPNCGTLSTRVHSRYQRVVHDLPNRGRPVRLMLFVRRFRCQKSTCGRKIFAEQFPLGFTHSKGWCSFPFSNNPTGMYYGVL